MSSSFWQNFTLINATIQESLLEKSVDIEGGGCAILFQDYVGIGRPHWGPNWALKSLRASQREAPLLMQKVHAWNVKPGPPIRWCFQLTFMKNRWQYAFCKFTEWSGSNIYATMPTKYLFQLFFFLSQINPTLRLLLGSLHAHIDPYYHCCRCLGIAPKA